MSGPRMGMSQLNGSNRRPSNITRMIGNEKQVHAQHDDLIKYIYDSWSKVEMDRGSNSVRYYQDEGAHQLKDFQPFDLEAYWGRRLHQSIQQQHS